MQKEREKEAEVNRRQANELKYLTEKEERSRREKEVRRGGGGGHVGEEMAAVFMCFLSCRCRIRG